MRKAIILTTVSELSNGEVKKAVKLAKEDRNGLVVNYLKMGTYASSGGSSDTDVATVVIKKSADILTWLDSDVSKSPYKNIDLVYAVRGNNYYINLAAIQADSGNMKKAAWLRENKELIDYDASGEFTLAAHRIPHPEEIDDLYPPTTTNPDPTLPTIPATCVLRTFDELKVLINLRLAAATNPTTFENDEYDHYIEFAFDGTGALDAKVHNQFTGSKQLFSLPMLRALEKIHDIKGNEEIAIGTVTAEGKTFYIIWVKKDGCYYDYSNEPR